jgi:hypothetical protein
MIKNTANTQSETGLGLGLTVFDMIYLLSVVDSSVGRALSFSHEEPRFKSQ